MCIYTHTHTHIYMLITPVPPLYYFKTINKTISQALIYGLCLFIWISSYGYDATKCGVGKRWAVANHCVALPLSRWNKHLLAVV